MFIEDYGLAIRLKEIDFGSFGLPIAQSIHDPIPSYKVVDLIYNANRIIMASPLITTTGGNRVCEEYLIGTTRVPVSNVKDLRFELYPAFIEELTNSDTYHKALKDKALKELTEVWNSLEIPKEEIINSINKSVV